MEQHIKGNFLFDNVSKHTFVFLLKSNQ